MSFNAYRWAEQQKTGSKTTKAVLLALASFADKDGFAWPSQTALAEKCEMGVRTVREALKALEAGGFIARQKRGCAARRARISDLILLNVADTNGEQNLTPNRQKLPKRSGEDLTGNLRQPYRQELPRNQSRNLNYPSQGEKFTEGYSSVTLGGTGEFDPDSNVVPFPLARDVA